MYSLVPVQFFPRLRDGCSVVASFVWMVAIFLSQPETAIVFQLEVDNTSHRALIIIILLLV